MKALRTMILMLAVAAIPFSAKSAFSQQEIDPDHLAGVPTGRFLGQGQALVRPPATVEYSVAEVRVSSIQVQNEQIACVDDSRTNATKY